MEHMGFQMGHMGHPPPRIFGGFTSDGRPLQHLPPDLTAQMFDHPILLDDAAEAKRRRIARVSSLCLATLAQAQMCD